MSFKTTDVYQPDEGAKIQIKVEELGSDGVQVEYEAADGLVTGGEVHPTITPEPTDTPDPTDTPEPTDVPDPTDTPAATETPKPTARPTSKPQVSDKNGKTKPAKTGDETNFVYPLTIGAAALGMTLLAAAKKKRQK